MGHRILTRLILITTCLSAGAQAIIPALPKTASVAEQYLFAAANMERASRGLPVLHWDEQLSKAAAFHAQKMAQQNQISHQFFGEPDLPVRGTQAGAKFSKIAENVAEAGTAVIIHDLWMHSQGHRDNLLDAGVDSVGIAVVNRGGQLFAVEDFDRNVQTLSLDDQEQVMQRLLSPFGLQVSTGQDMARKTCRADDGYIGAQRPGFVMRFTAAQLTQLPEILQQKLRSGSYHQVSVGACLAEKGSDFSTYRIAVLLYP